MPASREARRRRSSLANVSLAAPRGGYYGIHPNPRPVTFAPNITPTTYVDTCNDRNTDLSPSGSPSSSSQLLPLDGMDGATLFPPSATPAPAPRRKRCPPGKRRSQGYIPRPPNAFMLFRADFVRQKHVPGSIETNHGSLSKIIGNCWRSLPPNEKRVWEQRAKTAKAEHKIAHPDYRFRPVHNKNKNKDKAAVASEESGATGDDFYGDASGSQLEPSTSTRDSSPTAAPKSRKLPITAEEEERCEEVAYLLLEGKKGDELARAVHEMDEMRRWRKMQDWDAHVQSQPQQQPGFLVPDLYPTTGGADLHLHQPQPSYYGPSSAHHRGHRRSSSVPLPVPSYPYGQNQMFMGPTNVDYQQHSGITLPSIPTFFAPQPSHPLNADTWTQRPSMSLSRPLTPDSITRNYLGLRRASSAGPMFGLAQNQFNMYDSSPFDYTPTGELFNAGSHTLVRDPEALPEVDHSLFSSSFGFSASDTAASPPSQAPLDPSSPSIESEEGCDVFDFDRAAGLAPHQTSTGGDWLAAAPSLSTSSNASPSPSEPASLPQGYRFIYTQSQQTQQWKGFGAQGQFAFDPAFAASLGLDPNTGFALGPFAMDGAGGAGMMPVAVDAVPGEGGEVDVSFVARGAGEGGLMLGYGGEYDRFDHRVAGTV